MSAADPGTKPLLPLLANQRDAADPGVHAWVAASAGTGKTQVLTARVLRLLLAGAQAQSILCLTFTKLAAAEMQGRVMARLAHWAGCDDAALVADLAAISAPADADTLALARRLFARVLETPAGLAIQTIHAFAQGLIASFPVEAGITPGFQTLDDRAAALLRRRVLTAALSDTRDAAFAADVADVAVDGGETRLNEIMDAIGPHGPRWRRCGWRPSRRCCVVTWACPGMAAPLPRWPRRCRACRGRGSAIWPERWASRTARMR